MSSVCFDHLKMTALNVVDKISNYPCAICMGFCLEDENCIQCHICLNWFHKSCVNLSNERFRLLSSTNLKFTCTICIHNKKCEVCDKSQTQSKVRFLYCVTCLKHFCDDCNPFLNLFIIMQAYLILTQYKLYLISKNVG